MSFIGFTGVIVCIGLIGFLGFIGLIACILVSVERGSLNAERSVRMNTGSREHGFGVCLFERGSVNTPSLCSLNAILCSVERGAVFG